MGKNVKLIVIVFYISVLTVLLVFERKVLVGGWNGIIVGNLIASFYWVPFTFFHIDQLQRRHHVEQMEAHKETHRRASRFWVNSLYGKRNFAGPDNASVRHFENINNRAWLSTSDGNTAEMFDDHPDWREINAT